MKKIVVVGANGQLGKEFQDISSLYPAYQFFFFTKEQLNITAKDEVQKIMQQVSPHYLINCAAYTAVDKAETETELAFAINSKAVENLAAVCAEGGVKFIHISTDYVFDGTATSPYKENDAVNPANVYGRSKLQGEEGALKANKEAIVIRTAWVYSAYGNNFVKTMLRLMNSRPEINVVADQQGTPTYAADLAAAIMQIIESGKWVGGIYHFSNEGMITWFQFAEAIKSLSHATCTVNPISTEQYPTPAKRPKYSVLDKTKIQQTFDIRLKDWKESLQLCLKKIAAQQP